MKRFLLLIILLLSIAGCDSGNQGYGYNTKAQEKSTYQERWEAYNMYLYDGHGQRYGSIRVFQGEYDGKRWYVFIGSDGRMTVVENTGTDH